MTENILSFDNIIEAEDITETTVPIPEWNGSVVVRSLSYRKMGKLKKTVADKQGKTTDDLLDDDVDYEKAILVAGLVSPVVSEEQADKLMDKSASAVMKIISGIMGSSKNSKEALVEEEKKFPDTTE